MFDAQVKLSHDSCVQNTKEQLLLAIKKRQSTALGQHGLTYDILNHLVAMENSLLLDLFNISYEERKLSSQWKVGLIHPIPKGDQDHRPIALTSCMCKMRIVKDLC